MDKKDLGFKIVFGLLILTFIADIISTVLSWELLQYLESNPLFKWGGLVLPILINLMLMVALWYIYKKGTINCRFYTLLVMMALITTRIFVVYNNIQVALNPPTIAYLESLGEETLNRMKQAQIFQLIFMNILPFINGAFAWFFFGLDHKMTRRDKNDKI